VAPAPKYASITAASRWTFTRSFHKNYSASHGAGRVMSRTKAMQSFTWSAVKKLLAEHDVTLHSAGLDEVPGVYKNIAQVMAPQTDLVEVLGRFDPKLVKMRPGGEKAED